MSRDEGQTENSFYRSADPSIFDLKQGGQLFQLMGDVSDTDSTMVGGAVNIPFLNKATSADREPITAVGIPDFKNRPGDRLPLGHEQFQAPSCCLYDRQKRYRSVPNGHFD